MRTTVSIFIGLALILGFSVCAHWHRARTNSPVPLTPAMFDGYEFTLISNKRYADYFFDGGVVKTTSGQNAAVAMAYGWKIKDGNTLVFTDVDIMPAGSIVVVNLGEKYSLQFTSFGPTNVVTTAGERFSRSKFIRPL
jgi:hypothetical protein